jgi:hypothetical protein
MYAAVVERGYAVGAETSREEPSSLVFGPCVLWRPLASRTYSEVELKPMRGAPALCKSNAGGLSLTKTLESSQQAKDKRGAPNQYGC